MGSGIALGLSAAFCWGVADFCARGATQAGGLLRTLLAVQFIGAVSLLLVGVPTGLLQVHVVAATIVILAAAINLLIMAGAALLYRAFAIGQLAIVSPIAASYAAITALLSIVSGERPSPVQSVGIVLTLAGVVLVGLAPARAPASELLAGPSRVLRLAPGLIEALGAMLIFGVGCWALRAVVEPLGALPTAFTGKVSDLFVLAGLALVAPAVRRHTWRTADADGGIVSPGKPLKRGKNQMLFMTWVVPTAVLDTAANIAYNAGIATSLTSVVSVLSSLFTAVTVLLAWIFLRERPTRWQWLGALVIFAGVAAVSVPR